MSLLHLAAAAALAVLPAAAAPATDPTPTPDPQSLVVRICIAVDLPQVNRVLDGVDQADLVGPLAKLDPITVPDANGLVVDVTADLSDVRAALACQTPPATTTAAPTTTPAATTVPPTSDLAPTTVPTSVGPTTIVVPTTAADTDGDGTTQVTTIPVGGVATGDGSLAA